MFNMSFINYMSYEGNTWRLENVTNLFCIESERERQRFTSSIELQLGAMFAVIMNKDSVPRDFDERLESIALLFVHFVLWINIKCTHYLTGGDFALQYTIIVYLFDENKPNKFKKRKSWNSFSLLYCSSCLFSII